MQTSTTAPAFTLVPFTPDLDRSAVSRLVLTWRPDGVRRGGHEYLPADIELPGIATLADIGRAIAQLNDAAEKHEVSILVDVLAEVTAGAEVPRVKLPTAALVVSGPTEAARALVRGTPAVTFKVPQTPTPDDLDAAARASEIRRGTDRPVGLVRLPDADARPAAPAPRQVSRDWNTREVDQAGAERAARDEATAKEFGLALPPAFFALGTTLVQVGVDKARAERHAFERLPAADEAMRALAAQVESEQRRDLAVGLANLKINANGKLSAPIDDNGQERVVSLGVERDALAKLSSILRAEIEAPGDLGVVTALGFKACPDIVRQGAALWNNYVAEVGRREETAKERKSVVLRTRVVRGKDERPRTQAYAVVSESYGEVDIHRVAQAIGALPDIGLCRADVFYDGRRAAVDVVTQTTVAPEDQTVGDMHRLVLRVKTDDTGSGSLRLWTVAERIACRNRTLVDVKGSELIVRHVGERSALIAKLKEGLKNAYKAVHAFARQWEGAVRPLDLVQVEAADRKERDAFAHMVERFRAEADAAEGRRLMDGIYRSLLRNQELVAVRRVEDTLPQLRAAHHDPRNAMPGRDRVAAGLSRASVANGLTLWAQSLTTDAAHQVEALAGRVVSGDLPLTWLGAPASA